MGCGCAGSTWTPPTVPQQSNDKPALAPQGPASPTYYWTGPKRPEPAKQD